ncbi:MAG: response regulator, partial [Burkholderiales bacterium]
MPQLTGVKVMIVEDDDSSRQAFERMLNAAGFRVESFATAEMLLESEAAASAACLVLDIHLPGMSGFELRRELGRTGGKQPAVIFITAHDDPAARAQAEALGAAAFLPKPFAGRTLA